MTSIYFLVAAEERSRWHRLRSEEIWHYYEGAELELLQLSPDGRELERFVLGPWGPRQDPMHCVPANYWQAARSRGAFTLMGCTVSPPFQFADFVLLKNSPDLAAAVTRSHPAVAQFV
jgi:predicted cupin superfamily sugar epimerase